MDTTYYRMVDFHVPDKNEIKEISKCQAKRRSL